jgi:Kef-type K+ transport system membrane component KefB
MRVAGELTFLIFQLALLLLAGIVSGHAAKRVGLPRLVGELAAGVALGPTLLGALAPRAYVMLFPTTPQLTGVSDGIIQLGLLIFLFTIGAEVDLPQMRRLGARIVWTSVGGLLLPFAMGVGGAQLFPAMWHVPPHGNRVVLGLFMGTVLSISALPVIAKILRDLDLLKTDVGIIVMSAATLDDLVGWSFFAVILSILGAHNGVGADAHTAARGLSALQSPAAMFAAFIAGIAFARSGPRWLKAAANDVLAPLYFVSVGLKTNFAINFDPGLVVLIIVLASLGKIAGATVGARIGGTPPKQALAVGFGLNARGAMGIILAASALAHCLIGPSIFVAIVTMSLVTSLVSGPAMQRLMRTQ